MPFRVFRRPAVGGALLILLGLLSACGLNIPSTIPTKVLVIPTSTLAPILTATERFTATPIPSDTLIPSPTAPPTDTLPPPTATVTPSVTPTPVLQGVVRSDGAEINLRGGPGLNYKKLGTLITGSKVQVIATSTDTKWTLVQLDDGSQGWVSSSFVTMLNPSATVPALTTPQLTAQAQLGTAISLTQAALAPTSGVLTPQANAPTHVPSIDLTTDVLAYCDNPDANAKRNKVFTSGSPVVVFWSWVAKTPEQIQDQLNNAQYTVTVDGLLIGDWQNYASPVKQQTDPKLGSSYIVYWFVPIGQPAVGTHHIVFKLTWKQTISDGVSNYGPGSDNPANTGTCSFSVK